MKIYFKNRYTINQYWALIKDLGREVPLSTHRALQRITLSHNITSQGHTPNSPSKNNLAIDNIIRHSQSEK